MQYPPNQGWQQYNQQQTPYPQQMPPPQFQPYQPPPPKKKSKLPLILGVIAAILVLACIGTFALASNATKNTSDTLNTAATTIANGTTPTTGSQKSTGKWTTVQTITGNGTKKTAVFSVPDDWKIVYSCNGMIAGTAADGILGVNVYNSDGSIADPTAVNATCKSGSKLTTGETEEHQGGQVYLDINGTGEWKITVQELK